MQGEELRNLRRHARMTQGQLAEAIGMSQGFIGEMERGEKPIEERTARAIQHATGPIQFYSDAHVPPDLGTEAQELLDRFGRLMNTDTEVVSALVRIPSGALMVGMRRLPRE